jgi:long-subunit acyl-CoA synthetase (AMP-forming)
LKKHLSKVRKIKDKCPTKFIILIDAIETRAKANEIAFNFKEAAPVKTWMFSPQKLNPPVLHYTSGTTGQPKGVACIIPYRNI